MTFIQLAVYANDRNKQKNRIGLAALSTGIGGALLCYAIAAKDVNPGFAALLGGFAGFMGMMYILEERFFGRTLKGERPVRFRACEHRDKAVMYGLHILEILNKNTHEVKERLIVEIDTSVFKDKRTPPLDQVCFLIKPFRGKKQCYAWRLAAEEELEAARDNRLNLEAQSAADNA